MIQIHLRDVLFQFNDFLNLYEEPAVNFRVIEHLIHAHAQTERVGHEQNTAVFWLANFFDDLVFIG